MNNSLLVKILRWTAVLEGLSLLLLLFIAMPLKYFMDQPMMVEVIGMAHGVLFLMYVGILGIVSWKLNWMGLPAILSFIASFIPFGTFYVDKQYFKELQTKFS